MISLVTLSRPGKSFSISDLLIARSWAEYHDLTMRVELDYCGFGGPFEEVLAFGAGGGRIAWLIWRTDDAVIVQPALGSSMGFACLSDALDHLIPQPADMLTDLTLTDLTLPA